MTTSRVDAGVDLAALLVWAPTGGYMPDTPTTYRSSIGGSS